jgi:hypothetical protein
MSGEVDQLARDLYEADVQYDEWFTPKEFQMGFKINQPRWERATSGTQARWRFIAQRVFDKVSAAS